MSRSGPGADPVFCWVGALGYRSTGRTCSETYVRGRTYSIGLGRWTSPDSLWPQESAFTYARGNPTSLSDPTGMLSRKSGRVPQPCTTQQVNQCKANCAKEGLDYDSCAYGYDDNLNLKLDCGCKPKPCPDPLTTSGQALHRGVKTMNETYRKDGKCRRVKSGVTEPATSCPGGYGTHVTYSYVCGRKRVALSIVCCDCLLKDGDVSSNCIFIVHSSGP